jgi:dolichyl-diphosphooligosaccharide--protein glycosyltransferase
VITGGKTVTVPALDNSTPIMPEGPELLPTTYAALYAGLPYLPLQKVPALHHYRLVHESGQDAPAILFPESGPITLPGIKRVKIFEYVRGARIAGTGVIELPVVTNTGRTFTYRQESVAGQFIVPYSTTGNPYEVHAAGPYHLVGTARDIEVSETDVIQGLLVRE